MNLLDVVAWIPLHALPDLPIAVGRNSNYRSARDHLILAIPDALPMLEPGLLDVTAALSQPPGRKLKGFAPSRSAVRPTATEYIDVHARFDPSSISPDVLSLAGPGRASRWIAASTLAGAIEQLMLLSELARPSLIDSDEGLADAGLGQSVRICSKGTFHSLRYSYPFGLEWPHIADLDLLKVVGWVARTSYLHSALPRNRVERCLAAYTHLIGLGQDRTGDVLFRAMQGLEAFFCDGIGDLRRQLSEKSGLWLGPPPGTKNVVGQIYDARSKFVHGSAPFEYWGDQADPWAENEKAQAEFVDASRLASRMHVAALQRCIEQNILDISWSYSLQLSC